MGEGVEAAAESSTPGRGRGGRITPFRAWRLRQRLSMRAAAERLAVPHTVVRGLDAGTGVPNLHTTTRVVYGTRGELAFDDLLPPEERTALRRAYGYGGRRTRGAAPDREAS